MCGERSGGGLHVFVHVSCVLCTVLGGGEGKGVNCLVASLLLSTKLFPPVFLTLFPSK